MVAGLETITAGEILIGEKVVNDLAPMDRDIAMVFQNYALYPHMSVYDNMAFGLKMRKFAGADIARRVQEAAEILGIQDYLKRKPRQLSGGQRQRVALGRAIVRHPQCFLFDEPLSNLDAKLRVGMRAEIKQLHLRLGSTTVYVTHDQEEAMTLGDRVVVLKDGVIQQSGTPLEIYHLPRNRFVAGFLGSPQMNLFQGTLIEEGGEMFFDEGSARLPVPAWARAQLTARAGDAGREVVLGVRPESLSDLENARFEMARCRITMRVNLLQPLGDSMNVPPSTPKHENVIAQVPADARFRTGDSAPVCFDMSRAHFFAPGETGAALAQNKERWSPSAAAAATTAP